MRSAAALALESIKPELVVLCLRFEYMKPCIECGGREVVWRAGRRTSSRIGWKLVSPLELKYPEIENTGIGLTPLAGHFITEVLPVCCSFGLFSSRCWTEGGRRPTGVQHRSRFAHTPSAFDRCRGRPYCAKAASTTVMTSTARIDQPACIARERRVCSSIKVRMRI